MFRPLLICLFGLTLFSPAAVPAPARLAIAYVESGLSTTTSNSIENNLRKGAEIALATEDKDKLVSPLWIDQGETVGTTIVALEKIRTLKPHVLVGMGSSFQALLAAKRLDPSTVLITPLATSDEIIKSSGNVIMISNANSIQARLLSSEIARQHKGTDKTLLIEVLGCPYCSNMAEAVLRELKIRGISSTVVKVHMSQLTDSEIQVRSLKGFNHIILPVLEAEVARLIDFLYSHNPNAIYWGGDGWGTLARFVRELPFAKRLKACWLSHYFHKIDIPENIAFVRAYKSKFGTLPIDTSAMYFEATQLGIRLSGGNSAAELLANFRGFGSYKGLTGEVKIVKNHVQRPMPLLTLVNGEIEMKKIIQPEKFE